mgnify:FL=1
MDAPKPKAASFIDGGTALMDALVAIIIVGIVIKPKHSPPTNGADLGKPNRLKKIDNPKRPKTIEGIAARLFIFTSIKSVKRPGFAKYSRYIDAITARGNANSTVIIKVKEDPTTAPNIPALSGSLESALVKKPVLNFKSAILFSDKKSIHCSWLSLSLLSFSKTSTLNRPLRY